MSFVPFDAFWILVAALLVTSARILMLLRSHHGLVWQGLGRPGLLPRGLGPSASLTRFYWSRRVAELGDPALARWVQALRCLQILLLIVLVVLSRSTVLQFLE